MRKPKRQRGFVALMSVLLMSAMLLMLIFTLDAASFFSRYGVLEHENKNQSEELAESCVKVAMLRITENAFYTGGDCVSLGGECGGEDPQLVCRICSVASAGNQFRVFARAVYRGTYTNLSVLLTQSGSSFSISDLRELQRYGGSPCVIP